MNPKLKEYFSLLEKASIKGIEREVMSFRYIENYTQEEVSKMYGCDKRFISNIEENCLRKIKQVIQGANP
jgi:DNA-directed RNA polymerase specialized sigma subunit